MARACSVALAVVLTSAGWGATPHAADPPRRKPLDPGQRTALLALLNAVDAAQQRDSDAGDPAADRIAWNHHILKSQRGLGYVPFRLAPNSNDVLSVVFQIFDYGAPDADLSIEYAFYERVDGARRLFNRTPTQELTDDDLPPVSPWETQAFTSQSLALRPFPPGDYELEVTVRDRLTRGIARQSVAFSVR